jgi:ABC-type nitrate/sulfonate/bicarbonate transport system permease component
MPEMVKHGLAGEKVRRGVALLLNGASILTFLLVWTLASTVVAVYSLINPIFLPSSWIVFRKILDMALARQLEVYITATLQRVIIGFGVAAGLAVSLGILAGRWRWLRNLLEPVTEVFRPIPSLTLLPLFIVWVGIGEVSKIAFITYATSFPYS